MRRAYRLTIGAALALAAVAALATFGVLGSGHNGGGSYEVWALDQADTVEGGGGLLYIWQGSDIARHAAGAEPEVIDLAEAATAAGCDVATRAHMAVTNHGENGNGPTHVIVANVGSGDTFFIDVDSRGIVGCVNTLEGFDGAGGSPAAHASMATPDNSMVIVADVAGQRLHKIETDYATDTYELAETLLLGTPDVLEALGTDAAGPICHEFTADGQFAYVTLAGGGLLVVDVGSADGSAPMQVAHVYPQDTVASIGCGAFRLPDGRMLTNSESGAMGGDDFLYVFDTSGAADGDFPDPVEIELPGDDTHGLDVCEDRRGNLFALTAMRVSNHVNVVDLQTYEVVVSRNIARGWSEDPKPDILLLAPDGKMYLSLRGPQPLTAINALVNPDRTPGVAALTVNPNCKAFHWTHMDLAPMDDDRAEPAPDPHGLVIVER